MRTKMKKISFLVIVLAFLICSSAVFAREEVSGLMPDNVAGETDTVTLLTGGVDFDWVNMEQVKRDEMIDHYRAAIFEGNEMSKFDKKEFCTEYKDFLKDEERMTHYRLAYYDVKETKDANLSSFFKKFKDRQILYMYAIQYKNNMNHAFYYDVLGRLQYVDYMSKNYPNYPYYSVQYRSNGTIAGTIYFVSKDVQYTYNSDGEFKYLWYKSKMYDRKGKEIMTRTNW